MPKQKKADILTEIAESVKLLTERVAAIEESRKNLQVPENSTSKAEVPTVDYDKEYPKERVLVDEILNKHFNFRVEHEVGGFRFVVLVPRQFSDASGGHWDFYKCDERPSKVIAPNEAEVMLKTHLEKVFNSFSPDGKALIVNGR